jgi:hypothetical protein
VVCFEIHHSRLDEITLAKWYLELFGLFVQIAEDLHFHYGDFVGYGLIEQPRSKRRNRHDRYC